MKYNDFNIIFHYAAAVILSVGIFEISLLAFFLFPNYFKLWMCLLCVFFITIGICVAQRITRMNLKYSQRRNSPEAILSRRELEVFEQLLQKKTNKEISEELFIELSTVKSHINRIYKKMEITKRSDLFSRKFQL